MTVRLDTIRRRAVLDDAALAVGCPLAVEPEHDALGRPGALKPRAALEAAGALLDGRPTDWLAALLEVVARPDFRASVEMHAEGQLVVTAAAWGRGERLVLGQVADGGTELSALEPVHLPWIVAREVALRPYPEPRCNEPITVGVKQIEAAQLALDAGPHGLYLTEAVELQDASPAVRFEPANSEIAVEALLALFVPESPVAAATG